MIAKPVGCNLGFTTTTNNRPGFGAVSSKPTDVATKCHPSVIRSALVDTGTLLIVIFTAATAVFTAGIAFGGIKLWKVTERVAAEAAAERKVAEHARLRPNLEVRLLPDHLLGFYQQARLTVRYLPDGELSVLDRVEVEVLNDTEERPIDGPVWGPWQLGRNAEGVDERGRTAAPLRDLKRGREGSWEMFPSTHAETHSEENWREAHEGKPLKVRLTVRHEDMEWEYQPDGLVLPTTTR